jgi:hypothetical protein
LPKLSRPEPSVRASPLQVYPRRTRGNDEELLTIVVLEEQVFGVAAGKLALELAALRHREHGLVLDRMSGYLQLGQAAEQVFAGQGHWAMSQ